MATDTMYPDGDVLANWDTTTGANHYGEIDEGTDTPSDADYVETVTHNDVDRFSFDAAASDMSQCTAIALKTRCGINDASDTAHIQAGLFHSTSTQIGSYQDITTTDIGYNDGTLATVTKNWTSLTLTKAQMDTLEAEYTFQTA